MKVCEKIRNKIVVWVRNKQKLNPNKDLQEVVAWASIAFGVPWRDINVILDEDELSKAYEVL